MLPPQSLYMVLLFVRSNQLSPTHPEIFTQTCSHFIQIAAHLSHSQRSPLTTISKKPVFFIPNLLPCFMFLYGPWKLRVKLLSRVWLFATPWTVDCQAPPSVGFSRQEYWSGLLFPSPGDLPDLGIEPGSPTLQADSLLSEPPRNPFIAPSTTHVHACILHMLGNQPLCFAQGVPGPRHLQC